MKTQKLTAFLVAAMLAAGTALNAQVAPPTPASVAPNYGASSGDTSLALPKSSGPNLYLEAGLIYLKSKPSDSDLSDVNFFGPTVSFGWRINKNNKIQIDIGALFGSQDESWNNGSSKMTIDYVAVPELFTYSFCIPLDSKGQWELRLSPTIGFNSLFIDYKYESRYYRESETGVDTSFAYGAGVGVSYHINNKFYLDFGCRYLHIGKTSYDLVEVDDSNTHAISVAFGWKF